MCTYIVQNISHKTPSNKYLRLKNTFTISNFTFFPAISLQQNQIATPCELSITISLASLANLMISFFPKDL